MKLKAIKKNYFSFLCNFFQVKVNIGKSKEKLDVAVSPNESLADVVTC